MCRQLGCYCCGGTFDGCYEGFWLVLLLVTLLELVACSSATNMFNSFGYLVPTMGESSRSFAMLKPNASLGAALTLLVQAHVSSVPIVDEYDLLLDIYSRRAYAQIRLDEMSIHQALQLGQDATSPCGVFNGQRCQMCLSSDSLQKVMARLSNPGISHLTGELAKKAGQVVAVHLLKSVSNEHESANHQNVKFVSANATSLESRHYIRLL